MERARMWVEKGFGFSSNPWVRRVILILLLPAAVGLAFVAFIDCSMPWSSLFAMIVAGLLVCFLCLDSISYIFDLLYSSPREGIPLAERIDPEVSKAIQYAVEYVKTLTGEHQRKEIKSQAKEICSDWESRPPYPRVTIELFFRTILNFLITIFCFALLTIALGLWNSHSEKTGPAPVLAAQPTYGHDCFKDRNFFGAILHGAYYHSVIFQSLGDGEHSPRTPGSQVIASVETMISFLYIFLVFGGIYNAATITRDNLTPEKLQKNVEAYLTALCAKTNPITNRSEF